MNIDKLIERIKSKRELSGISDMIVGNYLEEYLKKNKINISDLSEKEIKIIVGDLRAELRKSTGEFRSRKIKKKTNQREDYNALLETHSSTKERIDDYDKIKEMIYGLKPKSIIDLGCGLNPIAMAEKNIFYFAFDIDEEVLGIVRKFFDENGIKGETKVYDLRKIENDLPYADVCLIFKVFDAIEKKGHKLAEKILKNVKSNVIIISFSTKTLSGKAMNHPQRGWIERLLERLGYEFKIMKTKNEISYIARKAKSLP